MIAFGQFDRCWHRFFILLLCLSGSAVGQTSNKGVDFWIPYTGHRDALQSNLTLFITSEYQATVSIKAGASQLPVVNLPANSSRSMVIDPAVYNVYIGSNNVVETNKGIHITSDKPIAVYSHIGFSARSSATLVFPTSSLGKEYYAIGYTQQPVNATSRSQFTIVGVEDGTQIEIKPTQTDINGAHAANQAFVKTLNKGEIYQYQSASDLSGSYISSKDCKPIAVFSGSTFVAFCEPGSAINASSGDNLYQQLLPVSAWGKNFVTAPFYNTENGNTDIFRIQIAEDNTVVSVNGSTNTANGTPLSNPYSKGSIITFTSRNPNVITASKPVSVAQLQTTQGCNLSNSGGNLLFPGDPEMTILNPIEQTLKDITLYSAVSTSQTPTNITKHYINIIIKTIDAPGLKINGTAVPISNFKPVNTDYSYLIYDVTQMSATNPSHRITANGGFVAIAYGYGNVESYAYLAGSDLKNLNKYLEVATANGQPAPKICKGNTYKVSLMLPYITTTLTWELGTGSNVITINNPPYSVETIQGDIFYKFEYNLDPSVDLAIGNNRLKAKVTNPNPVSCNAIEEIFSDIIVEAPPVASFTATAVCSGEETVFVNTSTLHGLPVKSWSWNFGDGTVGSTEMNPRHRYAAPGNYEVSLSVETESACSMITSTPVAVKVYHPPLASFSIVDACAGQPVLITDLSATPDDPISQWLWDFGDGQQLIRTNAAPFFHIYSNPGQYSVTLNVKTNKGCESTKTLNVTIFSLAAVDFRLPPACVDDVVTFQNLSGFAGTGSALRYEWNFGDPASGTFNTSDSETGVHKYAAPGQYQVSLTVISVNGCQSTLTKTFSVNGSNPIAAFEVPGGNTICSNTTVSFKNNSRVSGFGSITKIVWYFDYINQPAISVTEEAPVGGSVTRFRYPVHHQLSPKSYRVRMEAYSGTHCSHATETDILIQGVPKVILSTVGGLCVDAAPMQLQASERHGFTQSNSRFEGSGVTPSGRFNPSVAGPGLHHIRYYYTASNGCSDTAAIAIEVYPKPVVDLGSDRTILEGQTIKLNANVTGPAVTYQWINALNLSRSDVSDPVASPTETTVYTVRVETANGCEAQDDIRITVLKDLKIPNTFTPNGDGINDSWEIQHLNGYPDCTVTVYNRYGLKVLDRKGYTEGWDGRLDGYDLPPGTYYYVINPQNGKNSYKGSVTLLR
jgi:gliding motility-associated-like protein